MFSKILLSLFSVPFFALLFSYFSPAYASSNFQTDYKVLYTVSEDGNTHADLDISLTNKTTEYYASSYKIQVGFEKISNVSASDPLGKINPVIDKTSDGYSINLNFNHRATGIGQALNFKLSFDTTEVAKQYGKVWEIDIPGIANPEEFDSFIVEIKVPPSFGTPTYTKPYKPVDRLIFDKSQLNKSGISISFGDRQIYSFHLVYHIKNENLYPVETEIALPPSTNYQTVYIQNINPKPNNVAIDKDKNWLAKYTLGPSKSVDVLVDGKAEVRLEPEKVELSTQDRAKYLEEKPYWQVNSQEIQKLAKELKTPDAIYQFVVKSLKYDFARVTDDKPRLGAINALKKPDSAVCLEYTDLFIALARAAGIPAREVNGFAYTQNPKQRPLSLVKDILHSWPEYYDNDKQTWVMIDPTWGSTTGGVDYFTTLDFDHFAFVIKGVDSNYPIPAGGYKYISDKYSKDVAIEFAKTLPNEDQSFNIVSNLPDEAMGNFPIEGEIIVKNTSQTLLAPQTITVTADSLAPSKQVLTTSGIPPFGHAEVKAAFQAEPFLTNKKSDIKILVSDQEIVDSIEISPLLIKKWWIWGGGILIGIFAIIIPIIAIKGGRLRIPRRR